VANVNERSTDQSLDASMLPGLTPAEMDTLKKVFSSPLDIPAEWKAWIVSYLEANPPQIPIAQIIGFSAFTASYAEQTISNSITVANAWQTLANPGPHLDLPKGSYIVMYGCNYDASGGADGYMGISVNGAVPLIYAFIQPVAAQRFNMMRASIVDLPNDSTANTLDAQFQATQVGPSFSKRWVIALKYKNL